MEIVKIACACAISAVFIAAVFEIAATGILIHIYRRF